MMFPKPEPSRVTKARRDRDHAKARAACCEAVYAREGGLCQDCGRPVKRLSDPTVTEWTLGHTHEIIPRSLGGDDTDPNNCRLLCYRCHQRAHGLRVAA